LGPWGSALQLIVSFNFQKITYLDPVFDCSLSAVLPSIDPYSSSTASFQFEPRPARGHETLPNTEEAFDSPAFPINKKNHTLPVKFTTSGTAYAGHRSKSTTVKKPSDIFHFNHPAFEDVSMVSRE